MPTFKKLIHFLLLIVVALCIAGCLTCEKKEYVFQLTGENSGKLTIKYFNIYSSLIDSVGEISSDYDELVYMWYKGEKIELDFPLAKKFKKKLYEENGTLCGEVTMEFDDLTNVRLYRFKDKGPYMFSLSGVNDDGENFEKTNGEYGGEKMPVIFWPDDEKTLRFSTKIAPPDSTCVSMLQSWKVKKKTFR